MAGYNRIIMIGNLTRDPDYKQLPSGQPVCRLGLASNRQYRNKQTGSMVQEVCFIDVDVFGPQAESCRQFLQKGRPVLVEGRIKFDTWQAPDGQTRSKHAIVADRVVFLGAAGSAAGVQSENFIPQSDDMMDVEKPEELVETATAPKKRTRTTGATKATTTDMVGDGQMDAGELAFKDEPPFQDDLPF